MEQSRRSGNMMTSLEATIEGTQNLHQSGLLTVPLQSISGKVIDIPSSSNLQEHSSQHIAQLRDSRSSSIDTSSPIESPSRSESLITERPSEVPFTTATSSSTQTTQNAESVADGNNETVAIETDGDDDVILVASPLEVIVVGDDDDEDVQIVSHTGSQPIPKPLPSRSLPSLSGGANRLMNYPPILPTPPSYEIEEEIDTNLPMEQILGDLLDSHFGSIDFELPIIEAHPSTPIVIETLDVPSNLHQTKSISEQIRELNNVEIAIQTEISSTQEAATQTELPKKRKWEYNDEEGDGTACPVCLEPWEEGGTHRLVSLKCGHLFGESCLSQWFSQQGQVSNKKICPVCRTKVMPHHVRPIFARRVVQIKYEKLDELKAELDLYKKRCEQYEKQLNHRLVRPAQVAPPAQTIQHQALPIPVLHHGPLSQVAPPTHATGPFHPTNTAVPHPNIPHLRQLEHVHVYGGHPRVAIHDILRPFRTAVHRQFPLEQEYPL